MGEDLFENKVLDDMFSELNSRFEGKYQKKYGESKEYKEYQKVRNEINVLIKNNIKDLQTQKTIFNLLEQLEDCKCLENFFWNKQWYKKRNRGCKIY